MVLCASKHIHDVTCGYSKVKCHLQAALLVVIKSKSGAHPCYNTKELASIVQRILHAHVTSMDYMPKVHETLLSHWSGAYLFTCTDIVLNC